ncbi:MAG: E3 ubiquitin protein ligase [Rhabdochlamydiaceae bacterium]|nr:E3 ubiquitin protein ligase [Rhabdochlamydiaceae bacterium]
MAHLTPLQFCGKCLFPFNQEDIQIIGNEHSLLVTPCYHIFHQNCLGRWITQAQGTCPLCRSVIYQHQAGKEPSVFMRIFFEALQIDSDIVHEVFESSDLTNNECSADCLDELPLIALRYDSEKKLFFHANCASVDTPLVPLQELAKVVSKVVERHPHLPPKFIPTPPAEIQRLRIDYPHLYTAAITIGMISLYMALRRS